jgi:hypothetical protein
LVASTRGAARRVSPAGTTTPSCSTRKLRLHGERHLADLVEEDGATRCGLEQAAAIFDGSGEGAAPMPEELALEQRLGDGGAVHREERTVGATAGAMDRPRHQLLSRTGLAFDHHRDRRRCGALHQAEHLGHGLAGADDIHEALAPGQVAPQSPHLRAQASFRLLQASVELRVLDGDRNAARQRLEEDEVVFAEGAAAVIDDLDDADRAAASLQRCGEHVARRERRRAVDAGVEARVVGHVVDA